MNGAIVVYLFLYAGILIFLVGCLARIIQYARVPVHLRWELYPVPRNKADEVRIMVPEILFLNPVEFFLDLFPCY